MSHYAFVAFLRCEATQAEERAKHLRATALSIEANLPKNGQRSRKRGLTREKRTPTAYGVFVKDNYALIKNTHDDLSHSDIARAISRQWAATSEEEKQLWKDRAMAEKGAQPGDVVDDDVLGLAQAAEDSADDEKGGKKRARKSMQISEV